MLDPDDLTAVLGACPAGALLLGTTEARARAADRDGLVPPDAEEAAAGAIAHEAPRPGCHYLVRPAGRSRPTTPWAVAIDAAALDPARFGVDENAYFDRIMWGSSRGYRPALPRVEHLPRSVVSRIGCNAAPDLGRPTAGEWVHATIAAELDVSAQVRRSFEETDRIVYAGAIPATAVRAAFSLRAPAGDWDHPPLGAPSRPASGRSLG